MQPSAGVARSRRDDRGTDRQSEARRRPEAGRQADALALPVGRLLRVSEEGKGRRRGREERAVRAQNSSLTQISRY